MMADSFNAPINTPADLDKAFGDFCLGHPCLATAVGEVAQQPAMRELGAGCFAGQQLGCVDVSCHAT